MDARTKAIKEECDTCMHIGPCPDPCFNNHPGSVRAVLKTFSAVDVVDERGNRYARVRGGSEYVRLARHRKVN